MQKAILNHGNPKDLEEKRIAEIKALTYLERLERFFAVQEFTFKLKNAKIIQSKK